MLTHSSYLCRCLKNRKYMIRKTLLTIMGVLLTLGAASQVSKVELRNDNDQDIKVGHPHVVPIVTSDDDDVTIKLSRISMGVLCIILPRQLVRMEQPYIYRMTWMERVRKPLLICIMTENICSGILTSSHL